MVIDVTVRGTDDLDRVARRFREAGRAGLADALQQRVREEADDVSAFRASALTTLPRGGGLAARIAGVPIEVQVQGTAQGVTARVQAPGRGLDEGQVTHPVHGNTAVQVTQRIRPGWFTRPAEDSPPRFQAAVERATADVARDIERGI